MNATKYGTKEILLFMFKLTPDNPKDIQVVQMTVTGEVKVKTNH